MDLLEHPLEAVAFRLYSLPIPEAAASAATGPAAAWTCLAAVLAAAAAAGLWRLRSSGTAVAVSTKPLELDPSPVAEVISPSTTPSLRSPAVASTSTTTAAAAAEEEASSPKERYTAYYRDAGCVVGCCDLAGSDEDDGDENEAAEEEEEHEEDGYVLGSDGADNPFGWEEVVRPLPPLALSPTAAAAEMRRQRYRRSPTAALGGGGSVVKLWDQGTGAGGGLTPTASPRRRGRAVVVGAVPAF